jgi:nucleoside 2-deoxyribosyltransferase
MTFMEKNRIYCSGPLFCAEEIGSMSAIAGVLEEAGFQTFLPHRDGLERYAVRFAKMPVPSIASGIRARIDYAIFSLDAYELIERCSGVVCNLNGRVPDEGMIVEAALAYAAGKPLVLFKDDIRAPFGGYDNSMLTSLVHGKIVKKIRDLPSALKYEMSQKKQISGTVFLSDDLKKAVGYGKQIASVMKRLPEQSGKKNRPDRILSRIMDEVLKEESVFTEGTGDEQDIGCS